MVEPLNTPTGDVLWFVVECQVRWHPYKHFFSSEVNYRKIKQKRKIYVIVPETFIKNNVPNKIPPIHEPTPDRLNWRLKRAAISYAETLIKKRFKNITVKCDVLECDYGAQYALMLYANNVPIMD